MKIKYSALVMGVSGKLNGSVGATNKGGAYLRNKGVVSNPNTPAQAAVRSRFGALSSGFRALSPSQIAAWNAAAADFPIIDRLGDTRYLTGLGLYVQLNTNLMQISAPTLSDPPLKQAFPALSSLSVVAAIEAGVFSIQGTLNGAEVISTDFKAVFRYSPGVSPAIQNAKNKLRFVIAANGADDLQIVSTATTQYAALFGVPPAGSNIAAEVVLISKVSGESSAPLYVVMQVEETP